MQTTHSDRTGQSSDKDVRAELKDDADRLKDTAQKQGEAKAAQQKEQVASTAKSASSAMNTAADELRDDENAPEWLATSVSSAARQVDDLAERLQDKSPRDLVHETSRFARENPAAFLTASAALGFAAARFLRAGSEYQGSDAGTGSGGGQAGSSGMGSSYGSRSGVTNTASREIPRSVPIAGASTRTGRNGL